jgi:hypothetical protein
LAALFILVQQLLEFPLLQQEHSCSNFFEHINILLFITLLLHPVAQLLKLLLQGLSLLPLYFVGR